MGKASQLCSIGLGEDSLTLSDHHLYRILLVQHRGCQVTHCPELIMVQSWAGASGVEGAAVGLCPRCVSCPLIHQGTSYSSKAPKCRQSALRWRPVGNLPGLLPRREEGGVSELPFRMERLCNSVTPGWHSLCKVECVLKRVFSLEMLPTRADVF